jgi:AbrB family looped-hinge helix DNA binding protein
VYEVKLSGKNQIVIPREARIALNIKAGDRVLVVVRNGTVILLPKPKRYSKSLRGIARGLYPPDYLGRERESW